MSVFRTTDVTLTDLVVKGCAFDVSGELDSIIGIEACDSELASGTIRLHHIGFRENRFFGGAVAIQANATTCSRLEIEDFDFHANACIGVCGLVLAKENRIQNLSMEQNRLTSSLHSRSVLVFAPPKSSTAADGIRAFENSCPIFQIEGGSFNLSNSIFTKNSLTGVEDDSISPCIQLSDASVSIQDSSFEKNEASFGVAINAQGSNITLKDCMFRDSVAGMNGTIYLRNQSSLTINSCRFLSNRADGHGGGIYSNYSTITAWEMTADGNCAVSGGGSISITSTSNLTVHNSVFKNGTSLRGGAVEQSENSVGRFVDVTFVNNSVNEAGGSVSANNATVAIYNSRFREGGVTPGFRIVAGGFLSATHNSSVFVKNTSMIHGSAKVGGAIGLTESIFAAKDLNASSCVASNTGGAVNAMNSEFLCTNCLFAENIANGFEGRGGGAISVDRQWRHKSIIQLRKSKILKNNGPFGGESTEIVDWD